MIHNTIPYAHLIAALAFSASVAVADVTPYVDTTSLILDVTNSANFDALVPNQSLFGYQEDGLRVSINRTYFSWDAPGLDGTGMFYPSTGSLERVDITLSSGADFQDIDMQIGSGWSPGSIGTVYLWVQLLNDGSLVEEFDLDIDAGSYLGFAGGGFDQILIGSYVNAERRDLHNPFERNAIAIDNITAGSIVPAPAPFAVLGLGLLVSTRRERA